MRALDGWRPWCGRLWKAAKVECGAGWSGSKPSWDAGAGEEQSRAAIDQAHLLLTAWAKEIRVDTG
jgi:hypothetical protein